MKVLYLTKQNQPKSTVFAVTPDIDWCERGGGGKVKGLRCDYVHKSGKGKDNMQKEKLFLLELLTKVQSEYYS